MFRKGRQQVENGRSVEALDYYFSAVFFYVFILNND